jgi:hypothetical protein
MKMRVKATTEIGTKEVTVSRFIIPWYLLAMLPVLVAIAATLRAALRWRTRRTRAMREDIRRLEKLVTERQTGEAAAMASLARQSEAIGEHFVAEPSDADRIRALREGIKRAQRTGNPEVQAELEAALELEEPTEPALPTEPAATAEPEPTAGPLPEVMVPVRQDFASALADFLAEQEDSTTETTSGDSPANS